MNLNKHLDFIKPYTYGKPIHIIGVGAVGSRVAELVVRLGFNDIHIYDFDIVEDGNITNQIYTYRDMGMSKEDARCVLPNATATELVMTMNFRELIHVCEERLCFDAQEEIRQLMLKCKDCIPAELQKYCRPKCHRCRKAPCDKRNQIK